MTDLTPTEAVTTLLDTADDFDKLSRVGPRSARESYAKRAQAIRWIIAETAYPIEENAAESSQ